MPETDDSMDLPHQPAAGAHVSELRALGLKKKYGSRTVVHDVSLSVKSGEVVGLLGPNGAGKSTAFRLLAGLERPDAGTVHLRDVEVTHWSLDRRARAGLAYLPQHPSVLPRLTVRENLWIPLDATGRDRAGAEALLAAHDLLHLAARPAGALSGGERRRVEIARCLALEPVAVLLDEPFAGVDPVHVEALRTSIRALAAAGRAVLLTDHAVREALGTCDRAYLLDGGVVQVAGTPLAVAADPRARQRYLGDSWGAEVDS